MSLLCNPRARQPGKGSFQIYKWKSDAQLLLAEYSTTPCTFTLVKENSFTPFFEADDSPWSHSSYSGTCKPENSINNIIIWGGTVGKVGVLLGREMKSCDFNGDQLGKLRCISLQLMACQKRGKEAALDYLN